LELDLSRSKLRALTRLPLFGGMARLAAELSGPARTSGRLLVVGTPTFEPWHLVAHLRSSTFADRVPALVRFSPPADAPAHLRLGLDRIAEVTGRDSVLVVAPDDPGPELLERLADARRRGSAVLALAADDARAMTDLTEVSQDTSLVRPAELDLAQHLLPVAATVRYRLGGRSSHHRTASSTVSRGTVCGPVNSW
jgi:hypothetical protein